MEVEPNSSNDSSAEYNITPTTLICLRQKWRIQQRR